MTTTAAEAAVRDAYGGLSRLAVSLTDEQSWLPSGCTGWAVRDLLFHCLGDAHRALRALGTPAGPDEPADRDGVTYWQDWPAGADPRQDELRWTRVGASAWSTVRPMAEMYAEAAAAVLELAGRAQPDDLIRTQGHVLRVDDLLSTLAVEAAIHHLDLSGPLGQAPPAGTALTEVRRVLDALLGQPVPTDWDDTAYALVGTGRRPLGQADRERLGPLAGAFPLFG